MYHRTYRNTVNTTPYPRFDIKDYVRSFIRHIREKEGKVFRTNHYNEVMTMKEYLDNPKYTTFKSVKGFGIDIYLWNEQKVDFIPSNLKDRGFIFYFICNGCKKRVKYLYEYSTLESPLCRICCGLEYEAPRRRARELSRILRKAYLSAEEKCLIIRKAGITKDDMAMIV